MVMSNSLPSFLEPWDSSELADQRYKNAIFRHKSLGPVHALWWPCIQKPATDPDVVLLFIPGNPGLLGFYPPFLSSIQEKAEHTNLAILAHAHVGHTPGIVDQSQPSSNEFGLTTQIQNAIEALDSIKLNYGLKTKVVLLGHSVGAWISLQVLKARPQSVNGVFLLFPTISHIGSTPNGRSLSYVFRPPVPRIVSTLSPLARLPLSLISWLFRSWPHSQILVLRSLLFSPSSILAALTMAHEEMTQIGDFDAALLNEHKDRIWYYYAEKDDWVGEQREAVLKAIDADADYIRVARGHRDIPHAFCINHGEQVAEQCYEWLGAGDFLDSLT